MGRGEIELEMKYDLCGFQPGMNITLLVGEVLNLHSTSRGDDVSSMVRWLHNSRGFDEGKLNFVW